MSYKTARVVGDNIGNGNFIRSNGGKIAGNESHIASHGVSASGKDNWRTRANNKPKTVTIKEQ